MAKARALTKADQQLWAAFTQSIRPLPGRTRLPVEPEPIPAPARTAPSPPPPSPPAQIRPLHVDLAPSGIDKSTWRKFAAGKRRAERKLDLHGLTATRAHGATSAFIQNAYAEQIRCIEIVTGKGEILARELPHWLNQPPLRPLILAVAHPHAANTGAVRILLRRAR